MTLVWSPKSRPIQVVITPIWRNDEQSPSFLSSQTRSTQCCAKIDQGRRPEGIKRSKYYEWERKGVPLRLEIGARDVEGNSVFSARRTGGKKQGITVDENFVASVQTALDEIQQTLLDNALSLRESKTTTIRSYQELLDGINDGGFFIAPWKDDSVNEDKIKDDCRRPFIYLTEQASLEGEVCFYSGEPATHWALFARAY